MKQAQCSNLNAPVLKRNTCRAYGAVCDIKSERAAHTVKEEKKILLVNKTEVHENSSAQQVTQAAQVMPQ